MDISRRDIIKSGIAALSGISLMPELSFAAGEKSKVYFTKDLSSEGLKKIYELVKSPLKGKIAVKVHTGEPDGPNIIPRDWVKNLIASIPNTTIVECNVYYQSPRYTTEGHRETLKTNGWTFSKVDIMDENGDAFIPVNGGKWIKDFAVGKNMTSYDSMLVLTHFKGHSSGGFGGSLKNIAIGCASGRTGKKQMHTPAEGPQYGFRKARFMENMADGGKAIIDFFNGHITFINVLRNMSVDCDCAGKRAKTPNVPDIGIVASTDIAAADKASLDLVYALPETQGKKDLIERIESREGPHQIEAMAALGMGNKDYELIRI